MIGSLRGVILDRAAKPSGAEVLLEVGGVGYRVTVPAGTLGTLGELGGQAFVHVHTHVREDAIVLYGFGSRDERICFEALIGAHGVGPAVALAILSVHSPAALRRVLATDDVDALTLVPGIGKKTAVRLLMELKSKLDVELADDPGFSLVGATGLSGPAGAWAELRVARAGLGYGHDEVREALSTLPEAGEVEDLLRAALRTLAGAR
ncbi:MAG: holliday junction helicase RuvA [Acidimicrobiaceae bacterium]|nr:holliday junction helicase RuvA [Acidimicrobiaceae bacterium]